MTLAMILASALLGAYASADGALSVFEGQAPFLLAPRTALVIGIPDVLDNEGLLNLKNPAQDAAQVTTALRAAGFQVTNVLDVVGASSQMTRANITKAVYDFASVLRSTQGLGLIYYSGHAVQSGGKQYLLPYDGFVRFDRDLEEELLPATLLVDAFRSAGTALNILVIDGCRDELDTKDLPSFGEPHGKSPAVAASDKVILVYAALSGSKSLDGTADISPFASAFIDAVGKPDLALSEFFDSIGINLHNLPAVTSVKDVLNVEELPGRQFVFMPTIASFNREKQIYDTLTQSGKVDQMKQLLWRLPAGYFAAATADWLSKQPAYVAPPPRAPKVVLEAVGDSKLRVGPSLNSKVVGTALAGASLAAAGPPIQSNGASWFAIQGAVPGVRTTYLREDRARVVSGAPAGITVEMEFVPGTDIGTLKISDASNEALRAVLAKAGVATHGRIDVFGYTDVLDKQKGPVPGDLLLSREAAALSALESLGVTSKQTNMVLIPADSEKSANSVSVTVH